MLTNLKTTVTQLLAPIDCANTAAATSAWIDISNYEGTLLITEQVGVVTAGTITGKIQTATSDAGAGAADVTGATFTQAGTSTDNRTETIRVQCNACQKYIAYIGTIATGPSLVGVSVIGQPKY